MGSHSHAGPSRMNKPAGATSAATSAATSGASASHQAAEDDFKVSSIWAVRNEGTCPSQAEIRQAAVSVIVPVQLSQQ